MDREIALLEGLGEIDPDDVFLANVDDVLAGNNVVALENALSDADLELLHEAINDVPTLSQALEDADVEVEDVIGVFVLPDGQIIIYYQQA